MTTIKMCTDIPQSKKLAEFLSLESADMKWFVPADNEGEFIEEVSLIKYKSEYALFDKITDWNDTPYLPCWSLAALLSAIPKPDLVQNSDGTWFVRSWVNFYPWSVGGCSNPVDACVEMIIKLDELNLL